MSRLNHKAPNLIATYGTAALIGLALTAPFVLLEWRSNTAQMPSLFHFPLPLFGILWLLPTLFAILITPIVRSVKMGDNLLRHPIRLSLRIVFLTCTALIWIGIVQDQLPCFFGIPNCD